MKDNKVKISNILSSLIPDFIENDTTAGEESLFKQFLTQYYESEEREYGTTDIAENIAFNKKISTLSKMETVRAQTIPATGTVVPSEQIRVNGEVFAYDNSINVNHTKGFPEKYGLLKIDDEIITYTSKTDTTFIGCVRGFSGISEIETAGNPEFLTFSDTSATGHVTDSIVTNLGFNFLNEFYVKFKKTYLPGLENRTFTDGISIENILTRAKDFYTTKGTDISLDILFKVLFGKQVIIDKPFDNTISPSDARWIRGKQATVEVISGDPSKLKFSTLYQGTLAGFSTNSTATGAIEKVQEVFLRGSKRYFRLFLSPDTVEGKFTINNKTRVIAQSPSNTVVTVDSTVGFGNTGSFSYKASNGQYVTIQYGSKSYNQFFDCVGLNTPLTKNTEIIDDNFVFSYENNDQTKLCQMRLVGSIADVDGNYKDTKYFSKDDVISLKHLGEKTSTTDLKYSNWIYNNVFRCDIDSIDTANKIILAKAPHYLKSGDKISIDEKSTLGTIDSNVEVDSIISPIKFSYKGSGDGTALLGEIDTGFQYIFERKQDLVSNNLGLGYLIGDIQNTFVDSDKNIYAAFSGYPSYPDIQTSDRSKEFTSAGIGTTAFGITVPDHGFINGDKIYYEPIANQSIGPGITSTSSGVILGYIDDFGVLKSFESNGNSVNWPELPNESVVGIETGVYYVDVIDNDTIKLVINPHNIFTGDNLWNYNKTDDGFTLFPVFSGINTSFKHKITSYDLYDGGSTLKNQNNFKRILKNPKLAITNQEEINGPIGVGVDGIEIYSPVSDDSVYYGQLDKIDVLNRGGNYDVVNPPVVSIADTTGSSVECNVHVNEGVLDDILLTSRGWDYSRTPSVTVTGGNGTGVDCDAKMKEFVHAQSFSEKSVVIGSATPGKIGIGTFHRFDDGEEVIYTVSSPGSPVGVGSTNADKNDTVTDSSPTTLINGGTYYIASQNNDQFSLAATKDRALTKTKLIEFFADGSGTHTITSTRKRKIIDRIVIHTKGNSFTNNKVEVDARKYPPETKAGLSTTFVGINTYYDYIYARNHNFKEGDIVEYSCSGFDNRIVGLNTITQYKVNKVSNDKFKLADIGPAKDANYALGCAFRRTGITNGNANRLASHTYVSGATSWQIVDDASNENGFIGIWLRNLEVGEKYRISLKIDSNIELDTNDTGYMHRVHSVDLNIRTDFTHWNTGAPTGLLTGEFIARSENNDEFLFYVNSVNNSTNGIVNVTDFKVELIENTYEDYERKIYSNLISIGSGTHTFNYPDIKVSVEGVGAIGISSSYIPDYYYAKADPVVRGQISNLFIKSGGVGFGVSTIINYIRKPQVKLNTGSGAIVGVVIDDAGKVGDAFVSVGGTDYSSPPTLEVVGDGLFAQLKPNIVDGVITSVDVLNGGGGYAQSSTTVNVIPTGESSNPAMFEPYIHQWKINNVERYNDDLDYKINLISPNKDTIQLRSERLNNGNKLVSFYPNKQLRKDLNDNIVSESGQAPVEKTEDLIHSPILGWAYDGNPIYGPYGFENAIPDADGNSGGIKRLVSSYEKNKETNTELRPSSYAEGFFIDDYQYVDGKGDLDEYNGRFEINSDYPNGVYAYYHTLEGDPIFPYVTYKHYNQTDEFNYDTFIDQSDKYINNGEYRRNVTFLGLNESNREYPFLSDQIDSNVKVTIDAVKRSGLTTTFASNRGKDYKVGDTLSFSETTVVNGSVREILGKDINSIETGITTISNLTFSVKDKNVEAFSTVPHNLLDSEVVTISGISSSAYNFVEGNYAIGVATVATNLAVSFGATTTTGITTFIQLKETTKSDKFQVDDLIEIDNEQMKILNKDQYNNRYRVARIYDGNNITGYAKTAGYSATKLPQKFTFNISDNKELNQNLEVSKKFNFDAITSVGIGTTTDLMIEVGSVGFTTRGVLRKSAPAGGIYLPGHKFKTNDKVSYSVGTGSTIFYAKSTDVYATGNNGKLDEIGNNDPNFDGTLYVIKFNDEFIGITSTFNGSRLYYKEVHGGDHRIETIIDNVNGIAEKIDATIGLSTTHSLLVGDNINLNVTPNRTESHTLKYKSAINDLVLDPVVISPSNVLTSNSSIRVTDHKYNTGDSVLFTSGDAPNGLVSDKIYYVIKVSDTIIKLASSLYDATVYPYNNITISSTGSGNHELANVNLTINVYKGNTLEFDTSDSSLLDYDINFYYNKDFTSPYETELIRKYGDNGEINTNPKIEIKITDEFLSGVYYRLEGNLSLIEDPKEHITSRIDVLTSKFNKNHTITGVGDTTFVLNLVGMAETTSYTSSGISTAFYYTDSDNDTGPIYSINTINIDDTDLLPKVVSVATTTGSKAVFVEQSDDIGKILSTNILDQGFEFSTDNTLIPKADSYTILKLQNIFTLDSIGVTTGGRNYTAPPQAVAIGNTIIQTNTTVLGNAVVEVDIISNDSGLSKNIEFMSVSNSNGVGIVNATTNTTTKELTLELSAPVNGWPNNEFPFTELDKIYVEGIKVLGGASTTADGYNSSDYGDGNHHFTIKTGGGINTTGGSLGNGTLTYSIAGLGTNGGTFDPDSLFGRVVNVNDLAKFEANLKKVSFTQGEVITQANSGATGVVVENGWNKNSQLLKLRNVSGEFVNNEKISGSISNEKSIVQDNYVFDFDLKVDSLVSRSVDWETNKGRLNDYMQRLHDNDYYQRFSYAIKGEVPYDNWKEPIGSLAHISGYKPFSDLEIINDPVANVGMSSVPSDLILNIKINSESSVHERYNYDFVTENTDDKKFSKTITFKDRIITDYSESRSNKVLLIDDISEKFTGSNNTFTGVHQFIRDELYETTGSIAVIGGGNLGVNTDGTSYNPSTGLLTLTTSTAHGLSTNDEISLRNNSLTFACDRDSFRTEHKYPRATDPASISNSAFNSGVLKVTVIDSDTFTVFVNTPSVGGQTAGISTFTLYTVNDKGVEPTGVSTERLFYKTVNPAEGIDLTLDQITIKDHEFNTGEELVYSSHGSTAIQVDDGSGGNMNLPTKVFAINPGTDEDRDRNKFKLASSASNANSGTAFNITSVGTGNAHTFAVTERVSSNRTLISIDNMIQSPLAFNKQITLELFEAVGIGSTHFKLKEIKDVSGGSILKIEDELFKITGVGIGSTNSIQVDRAFMGTTKVAHVVGSAVTAVSGDYRIENGIIHFSEAPYEGSDFAGRSYYRKDYTKNKVFDDISESFDGQTREFLVRENGTQLSGIGSEYGMVLINNIFQDPEHGHGASGEYTSDYKIKERNVGLANSITFTGTYVGTQGYAADTKYLPKGGIINEFSVDPGVGIAPKFGAMATATVNADGSINSTVGLVTCGSGYLSAPRVGIAITNYHFEHKFVSAATDAINVTGGSQFTPTYATYNSTTGELILTIGTGHNLTTANTITIDNNSLTFQCSRDGYLSNKTYPRSTDPASTSNSQLNTGVLPITNVGTDSITVNVGRGAGVGAKFTATVDITGTVTGITVDDGGTGYDSDYPPIITIDEPKPWKNIPLIGGGGSGATMDVVVGTGGSAISYSLSNPGIGYSINDELELSPVPYSAGITTSPFKITVLNRHQDKFSGRTFGQLLELDDFSKYFNGFRRTFLITRTAPNKEYYSINSRDGAGIVLANNLLIFINDVLQQPVKDYTFSKGTKITFNEPPRKGSKLRIHLYVASSLDYEGVDVDPSIKPGDKLKIQKWTNTINNNSALEQDQRVVYELISSDSVDTQSYSGVGILTSENDFERPVMWEKQTTDKIIDGIKVSKSRVQLEPQIYPSTNIIKSVSETDTKIYVRNNYPSFTVYDSISGSQNSVTLVGLGTTALDTSRIETITNVTEYDGDYGQITAIKDETVGSDKKLVFDLTLDPNIKTAVTRKDGFGTRPGISTGDYFVIENTNIGDPESLDISSRPNALGYVADADGLATGADVSNVVGIGSTWIDNVYQCSHWTSTGVGNTSIRVETYVLNHSGITTTDIPEPGHNETARLAGTYSWGYLSGFTRNVGSTTSFTFYNQNGIAGIETSAHVSRTIQLKTEAST